MNTAEAADWRHLTLTVMAFLLAVGWFWFRGICLVGCFFGGGVGLNFCLFVCSLLLFFSPSPQYIKVSGF